MRLRSTREGRPHGCGGSGGVLLLRRSFHHSTARPAATAMAAARTNGVRPLPLPLGGIVRSGTTNSKVRVTDCPCASVTVTETRYVPVVAYVWAGFGASLCPPSPKSQRYVYGGVPPVTLAVKLTLIPVEPSRNRVGGATVRLTAAGGTVTEQEAGRPGGAAGTVTVSQTRKVSPRVSV